MTAFLAGAPGALFAGTQFLTATAADQQLTGIAGWAVNIMDSLGGIGVMLLIALENLFPPLPSEIILPLAGFTAKLGNSFGLVEAIIWATAGSLLGAIILYWIARWFGRDRTRYWMAKIPLMNMSDVDKTEEFFTNHNRSTVFFGRMLPIFRSLISLPAGVVKMPMLQFIVLTTLGSAIWNTVLIGAGYVLGAGWTKVEGYVGNLSNIVIAVIVVAVVAWIAVRLYRRAQAKKNPQPEEPKEEYIPGYLAELDDNNTDATPASGTDDEAPSASSR